MRQERLKSPSSRSCGRVAIAVVAVLLAGGCGADSPRPVATPNVRWVPGEPRGDIETDPWVEAVRAAELAHATAINSANYTDPSLHNSWRADHVDVFAQGAASDLDNGLAHVMLGPMPFTPLAVEMDQSGDAAAVRGCAESLPTEPELEQGPGPWPQAFVYRLELGSDGHRRVTSSSEVTEPYTLANGDVLTDEYCATVEIPRGTFDPRPDLEALRKLQGSDVIAPPRPSPTFDVEWPK